MAPLVVDARMRFSHRRGRCRILVHFRKPVKAPIFPCKVKNTLYVPPFDILIEPASAQNPQQRQPFKMLSFTCAVISMVEMQVRRDVVKIVPAIHQVALFGINPVRDGPDRQFRHFRDFERVRNLGLIRFARRAGNGYFFQSLILWIYLTFLIIYRLLQNEARSSEKQQEKGHKQVIVNTISPKG